MIKTCELKIKYKTKTKAWDASVFFFTQYGWYNTPYKCPGCKYFHLTNKLADPSQSKYFREKFNEWFGQTIL